MTKVKDIIEKYFREHYPEEVRNKFLYWLKNPVDAKEKEEAMFGLWNEAALQKELSGEKSFRQVEQRLGFPKKNNHRTLYLRVARIAAVFLIPLLSFLAGRYYMQQYERPDIRFVECYVPHGERRELFLPDNSHVVINSGSLLLYPQDFHGKTREIYLSGEAKFTVAPDKKKPFIVQTNDMEIEALGTVFNISSYPENSSTVATLIEGKVGVDIKSSDNSYILNPKEQIIFDKKTGQSTLKEPRLDYVLAWEKGQMIFQGASLPAIIKEIERHYAVTVYLNATGLSDEKLTLKFVYDEPLQEVLYLLQQIIEGFRYKIEGENVFIY